LTYAIDQTLSVRNADVTTASESGKISVGTGTYNSPGLYRQVPASTGPGRFGSVFVISGAHEYFRIKGRWQTVLINSHNVPQLNGKYTLAQQVAFPALILATKSSQTRFSDGRYVFTVSDALAPHVAIDGGSLTVSGGFIRQASLDFVIDGHHNEHTFQYAAFDSTAKVVLPR
jgi:hypothetical protein